jgi:hypothetical protein
MVLVRRVGNRIIKIDLAHLKGNEQEFIDMNPTGGFMMVDELPDCLSQKWTVENDEIVVDEISELKKVKENKLDDITKAFNESIKSYTCSCGIKMDATVEDMRLLEDGINYIEEMGGTDIEITDYNNNQHTKTIAEARVILKEEKDNFFTLRNKKISLRENIKNAVSVVDVESMIW